MVAGIRTLVEFDQADICPIVELSARAADRVDDVARSVCVKKSTGTTSEFTLDLQESDPGQITRSDDQLNPVFSHRSAIRYRLSHEDGFDCPCEYLGAHGYPVSRYVAEEGTLQIEFCAAEFTELQALVAELRERYPSIELKRLIRSPATHEISDVALVDTSALTRRQRQVLETAHECGYFAIPREANMADIADEMGLHPSTVSEHLKAAERKVFDQLL